eukprot:g5988.t1
MENKEGSIYTPATAAEQLEQHELADTADVVYTGAASIEAVDPALLGRFEAVMLRRCAFGAPQLALLPRLRHVMRMGAGYDNVDVAACAAAGVVASNCPDAWVEEVADNTMSLMLCLLRRTAHLSAFVAAGGGWTRQAALGTLGVRRLRGLRLGIVGLGRIGTAVAQRARAFGLALSCYDPYLPPGAEKGHGGMGRVLSFEELLRGADIISFHCPLTAETRHMLDRAALRECVGAGRGLFVVNAARGGVLDEAAVLGALRDGRLAGVALDTLESEPAVHADLLGAAAGGANLLLSPHASFYSDEAFLEMRALAAREVRRVLRGEQPWYSLSAADQ